MADEVPVWGIHNKIRGQELIDGGFVSIGWAALGDLNAIRPSTRAAFREALRQHYPDYKPGAYGNRASILYTFAHIIKPGDLVVFPNSQEQTIAIGTVTGPYEYVPTDGEQPHHRSVSWIRTGIPRTSIPQEALYGIGSLLTVFRVGKHAADWRQWARDGVPAPAGDRPVDEPEVAAADAAEPSITPEHASSDAPRASELDSYVQDFVLKHLQTSVDHRGFELLVADIMSALGYFATATRYSQDGGIDVVVRQDVLGARQPTIKVQCKHIGTVQGSVPVQQLLGATDQSEQAVFVTLGGFTRDAEAIERNTARLRLISGPLLVSLFLRTYNQLPTRWRTLIPLRQVWAVDDADGEIGEG